MRAIKTQELLANRDNRNQWRISPAALDRWRVHSVRTPPDLHTMHTPETVEIGLRERLAAETTRADVAEAMLARERAILADLKEDRDRWRQQAAALLPDQRPPPRKWWSWGR